MNNDILKVNGDDGTLMDNRTRELNKLQTYARNYSGKLPPIDDSDIRRIVDDGQGKGIIRSETIDREYDGLIDEMGDLEKELVEMQVNLRSSNKSVTTDRSLDEETSSDDREDGETSNNTENGKRRDTLVGWTVGLETNDVVVDRRESCLNHLIDNANKSFSNRQHSRRLRRSSSVGSLREFHTPRNSLPSKTYAGKAPRHSSVGKSNENLEKAANVEFYQDSTSSDDGEVEMKRGKTSAKQSISVDLFAEEEKPNFRRKGLNFAKGDKDDDYVADLFEFKMRYKEKGRGKGLRIARSVENLAKLEKKSFLKKKLGKYSKVSEPPREKGRFRSFISEDDEDENSSDETASEGKIGGTFEMHIDAKGDLIRKVVIYKKPNQSLGFFIRFGNGIDREGGLFISRVTLGSFVDDNNLLATGDEIIRINEIDVEDLTLEDVASMMQKATVLKMDTKSALPLQHATPLLGHNAAHDNTDKQRGSVGFSKRDLRAYSDTSNRDGYTSKKPRSYTDVQPDDLKMQNGKSSLRSKGIQSKLLKRIQKSIDEEANLSSSSDSEDFLGNEKQALAYASDSFSIADSKKSKKFTGKLAVDIIGLTGVFGSDCDSCYCSIDVDSEFKAKTVTKKIEKFIKFHENFDIDMQEAIFVTIHIYGKQRNKKETLITDGCINLGKLLANDDHAEVLLVGFNEKFQIRVNVEYIAARLYMNRHHSRRMTGVFGFNLSQTLVSEMNTIPILVRKCVEEIEKRGVDIEGIYRISGNARKKKVLRHQFEKNSAKTNISGDDIDCHIITGTLKDYLRELPNPLISQDMYMKIAEKFVHQTPDETSQKKDLSEIIKMVAYTNRATLIYIMDHLRRVAAQSHLNKMDFKNLAVCFGPVMMCPPTLAEMQNFKKQIDALEYLLKIWPDSTKQNLI